MIFDQDLKGTSLPRGTVCLTYDDGPGPQTAALAAYLGRQKIPATFFVLGQLATSQRRLLAMLTGQGHLLGNHTWSHAGLVDLSLRGGDVAAEIAQADEVIRGYVGGPKLLRPPYGSWRQKTRSDGPQDWSYSIVARQLRDSGRIADYIAPVKWDVSADDFECYRRGHQIDTYVEAYLAAIEQCGGGIVLLHDGSEEGSLRRANRAAELTVRLVPQLQARGFRFVRADEVPEIRQAIDNLKRAPPLAVAAAVTIA